MKKIYLLIFLFTSFSFSATEEQFNSCVCSGSWLWEDDTITTGSNSVLYSNQYTWTCVSGVKKEYDRTEMTHTTTALTGKISYHYKTTKTDYICSPSPCSSPNEVNSITGVCELPPIPPPPSCENNQTEQSDGSCRDNCPEGQYDTTPLGEVATCECIPPTYPEYDIINGMTCKMPTCETVYNGLKLFATVENQSQCNFFAMSESAYIGNDLFGCCYGQQNDENETGCPPNTLSIGGECMPIDRNETLPPDYNCQDGSYYNFITHKCEVHSPNLTNGSPISGGDNSTPTGEAGSGGTGTTSTEPNQDGECPVNYMLNPITGNCALILPSGTPTEMNGTMDGNGTDYLIGEEIGDSNGDGYDDAYDGLLGGVKESMDGLLNGYFLLHVPVTATGSSCNYELIKEFVILGNVYTLNLTSWFNKINEILPTVKQIFLFMSAFLAVIVVLSA